MRRRTLKWLKWLAGVLLLPVCAGAALALERVLRASGGAELTWVPLLAGAACWLGIYLLLPRPMWLYVFGHELTHALWTWLFGGRVKRFHVTGRGGHVIVTRSNFLIALAPYFFPIYAVLVIGLFGLGNWLWDWQPYLPVFHLLLGAAYGFHVTLTWHILQSRQTDITEHGYLFSAVIIFLGNVTILLLGVPWLTRQVGVLTALAWWWQGTVTVLQWLTRNVAGLVSDAVAGWVVAGVIWLSPV